jgi:RsiW-degrading membrane proteinase PrsW (M82 family)
VPYIPLAAALAGLTTPVVVVWLALVTVPRAARSTRTDLIGALGCGLIAVGAVSLLTKALDWTFGVSASLRLTVYTPLIEEPLKALAIVLAIGTTVVARGDQLSLRQAGIATLAVVAAFATGENVGHLVSLFTATDVSFTDASRILEALRVRAVLPPLGHLAETWPAGAALWLASRCRQGRPAILLSGVAAAIGIHSLWNWATLQWWPSPWPLLAILAVSLTVLAGCVFLVRAHQSVPDRRDGGLGAVRDAQLEEDLAEVDPDRAGADVELARDHPVRQSLGRQAQHLAFPAGQAGRTGRGWLGEQRDRGRLEAVPAVDGTADGLDEPSPVDALEQVAARAGGEQAAHRLRVGRGGEDDRSGLLPPFPDCEQDVDARHVR